MPVCSGCKKSGDSTDCYSCDACKKVLCSGCSGLQATEIRAMELKKRILQFKCSVCQKKGLATLEEIRDIVRKEFAEQFQNVLNIINVLKDEVNLLNKSNVDLVRVTKGADVGGLTEVRESTRVKTFVDAVMIKPVRDQSTKKTKQDLVSKIDPSKLKVGIENVNVAGKGAVVVNCSNENSKSVIRRKVEEELGDDYRVEDVKLNNPRMVIRGLDKKDLEKSDEEVVLALVEQNDLEAIDMGAAAKIKVIRKFVNKRNRNYGSVVIDVEPKIYSRLKAVGKVNIGWQRCVLGDYYGVIQCYKCAAFGHFSRDCEGQETCFKCGSNHKTADCESEEMKCVNCSNKVRKLKINLNVNHAAYDRECACYKRVVEQICRKTRNYII